MIQKYEPFDVENHYLATDEDILAFEQDIGYSLPQEYKEFVKIAGNTFPEPECYPIRGELPDGSTFMDCYGFYGFYADSRPTKGSVLNSVFSEDNARQHKCNDLYEIRDCYRGRMPDNLLPIGWSSFGDAICLMLDGQQKGSIWFWDHEDERDASSYENCYFLASSIGEFIKGFESEDFFEEAE